MTTVFVVTPIAENFETVHSFFDANQRLVVAGNRVDANGEVIGASIYRFTDSGQLDSSFNGDGLQTDDTLTFDSAFASSSFIASGDSFFR